MFENQLRENKKFVISFAIVILLKKNHKQEQNYFEELSICCFGAGVISAGVGGGVSNAFGLLGLENSTTFCFFVVVDE